MAPNGRGWLMKECKNVDRGEPKWLDSGVALGGWRETSIVSCNGCDAVVGLKYTNCANLLLIFELNNMNISCDAFKIVTKRKDTKPGHVVCINCYNPLAHVKDVVKKTHKSLAKPGAANFTWDMFNMIEENIEMWPTDFGGLYVNLAPCKWRGICCK